MTKIIAVIAIVVIVAAACVFVFTNDSNNSESERNEANIKALTAELDKKYAASERYPADLLILGNADMDDDLDNDDIAAIQKLIGTDYNYIECYMADANYDGYIDQKDVDYVKKLIDFEQEKVYYMNVDFQIKSYLMKGELHLANIITQILECECIIAADKIVATDERCAKPSSMGTFWTEFDAILDYSKLGNIGSHKSPNQETYAEIAKNYGNGYLTVWMNRASANNTGYMDDAFVNNEKIQIIRLPTWENDGTVNGILTAGYLFNYDGCDSWNKAVEFVKWYKETDAKINGAMANVSDDQIKKVLIYADATGSTSTDFNTLLNTAGERLNLLELKIIDVVGMYAKEKGMNTNTYSQTFTKEDMAEIYNKYGLDLIVGSNGLPYNCTAQGAIDSYNLRSGQIENFEGTDIVITGWINASGPGDLIFKSIIGGYLYEKEFNDAGIVVKDIVNQYLKLLGNNKLTADDLNLLYAGEGNPHNIMVNA